MPKAIQIVRKPAVRQEQVVDTISLDHAARTIGSGRLTAAGGLAFDVALDKPAVLDDGDALRLDDGRLVTVRAAEETLLEVTAGNPARLLRLAWQLGGSHVPVEVDAESLYAPTSAAELVRGAGCTGRVVSRPFKPEKALHDHGNCDHDHHHQNAHEHHGHEHRHDHHHHEHGHHHDAHDH